ncbi:MAG: tetraacyldisaccharide 4'-kinase [bacterium]|nr:tetraacyldisaccharide 4'-kinase [bacterium]
MNRVISYYFDIISGKRRGLISFFIRGILFILSVIYIFSFKIRNIFYSIGLFKTNKLYVPVISVGNVTLGGTGKTPFIIWLAEYLYKERYKTGILTRGYGRENKNNTIVLLNKNDITDYNITGDEPLLIKNNINGRIPVIIGSNRAKSGSLLYDKFDTDVILLDDGFQHISLKRDLNIAVIDALNPFGNYKVFPAGILREKIDSLKRADIFLITKVDLISFTEKNKIIDIIKSIVDHAVIIEGIFLADKFISLKTKNEYSIEYVSKNKCIAFSGIGNPDSFARTLKNINVLLLDHLIYPDHYSFSEKDINDIIKRKVSLNSDIIITTEKDSIRLYNIKFEDDILFLSIKLKIISGEEILKERIKKILK